MQQDRRGLPCVAMTRQGRAHSPKARQRISAVLPARLGRGPTVFRRGAGWPAAARRGHAVLRRCASWHADVRCCAAVLRPRADWPGEVCRNAAVFHWGTSACKWRRLKGPSSRRGHIFGLRLFADVPRSLRQASCFGQAARLIGTGTDTSRAPPGAATTAAAGTRHRRGGSRRSATPNATGLLGTDGEQVMLGERPRLRQDRVKRVHLVPLNSHGSIGHVCSFMKLW